MLNKFIDRIEKLRLLFPENKIDSLFISKPEDVSYFTGTKGDDLFLFVTDNNQYLITDFRYKELAQSLNWFTYYETDLNHSVIDLINGTPAKKIGVCRNSLNLDTYLKFRELLIDKDVIPVGDNEYNPVNELRIIKDDEEIQYTKCAEDIGSEAFGYILEHIKVGMTEKSVALALEDYMLKHGADGISFDTICISGAKTSMPHGVPDSNIIKDGDFVTMDFGCTYKGYHSDMTRTIAIGSATDEMKSVYGIVLEAQKIACNNIKSGLNGDVCHHFALDFIEKMGYGQYFGHGLGHGTGLEIHEAPRLSLSYKKEIPVNSIVSIEPGIYIPGKFGVRIEDLAVVKENGIINLTSAPKELIII